MDLPKNISEELFDVHRKGGLRYTSQRQEVWNELQNSDEHRDAEQIYLALRSKGLKVSRATVYRTIDVLVKNKLLRKMDVGDGRSLYESRHERHDHMICIETGKIVEFNSEELEMLQDEIAKKNGYTVVRRVHQLFVKPI